jgi:hypothetical protein
MIVKSVPAQELAPATAEVHNPHMDLFYMLAEAPFVELLTTMVPFALGARAPLPRNSVNFM